MKEAIITSTLHLINKNGLHALCLEKIAESIGISDQEVRAYFKTKSSLVEYLLKQHLEAMELHLYSKNQTDTLHTLLSSLTQKSLISQEEHAYLPCLSEAFLPYLNSFELKYMYHDFYNELHQFYMEDLEERIVNNELNEELDTYTLATMLVSMIDSNILYHGSFREKQKNDNSFLNYYLIILNHYIKRQKEYIWESLKQVKNTVLEGLNRKLPPYIKA